MTKYIFYFLVLVLTKLSAQKIEIQSIEQVKVKSNNLTDLTLKFNKITKSIKKCDEFVLEIQPINDCLKDLEGEIMFDLTLIDLKNSKNKEVLIDFKLVKRKCFKWRIKTVKDQEINYSDWNFHSFVR